MGSSGIPVILALMTSATHHVTRSSAGSQIGPGLPIGLALIVIGFAIYTAVPSAE
jgi:hypothetical protein